MEIYWAIARLLAKWEEPCNFFFWPQLQSVQGAGITREYRWNNVPCCFRYPSAGIQGASCCYVEDVIIAYREREVIPLRDAETDEAGAK